MLFRNSLEEEQLEPDMFHLYPDKSDTELFRNVVRYPLCVCVWCVLKEWGDLEWCIHQTSSQFSLLVHGLPVEGVSSRHEPVPSSAVLNSCTSDWDR